MIWYQGTRNELESWKELYELESWKELYEPSDEL
jgi:hypothetical protein